MRRVGHTLVQYALSKEAADGPEIGAAGSVPDGGRKRSPARRTWGVADLSAVRRGGSASRPVIVLLLLLVIALATSAAVYQFATDARRERERERLRNARPESLRPPLSPAELAELSVPLQLDTAWLDAATEAEGLIRRFGTGDSVVVYAVVPEHGCQMGAVEALEYLAEKHEGQVRVAVFRLDSEAAGRVGLDCAGYIVNSMRSYTYTAEDGSRRTAVFKGKPEQSWTEQELVQAVEAALEAASADTALAGQAGGSK